MHPFARKQTFKKCKLTAPSGCGFTRRLHRDMHRLKTDVRKERSSIAPVSVNKLDGALEAPVVGTLVGRVAKVPFADLISVIAIIPQQKLLYIARV